MSGGPETAAQLEALAYVMDALRRQEHRHRMNHWPVPASVPALVDEIGFRVSRGQSGSPDAAPAQPRDGGVEARLMVRYETAARMLEVSMSTVKRLVRDGSLPVVHVGRGISRIRVADLEAFTAGLNAQPTDKTEVA